MKILPIHPDDVDQPAREPDSLVATTPAPSRRTLGRWTPSRRTLGRRGIPCRRTLGRYTPSRRTLGYRGKP